jgi:alpha-L-fucosidase 2
MSTVKAIKDVKEKTLGWMLITRLSLLVVLVVSCQNISDELLITQPEHGFVSRLPAARWEESMITGNGTIGALVYGNPLNERIILSHEKLFMPEYPPYEAPPLHKYLDRIRELTLEGKGEEAAELLVRAGEEVGIEDMIWTDALIPACQMIIESLEDEKITDYTRSVNYETGEAITAWKVGGDVYRRYAFFSRADSIGVMKITGSGPALLNFKFRLEQLPINEEDEEEEDEESVASVDDLILKVNQGADGDMLFYTTVFKKQWENSLKGYSVASKIKAKGGNLGNEDGWLVVENADEILVLMDIKLSYSLPLIPVSDMEKFADAGYEKLLDAHKQLHSKMFNRFNLQLGSGEKVSRTAEDLLASSSAGNLNPDLVNRLCEASRYALISSTGEIPPTLQGIWGGTWRPAWSSDFTLNGNVPSVIACGLNTNLPELTESYLNYMWSMFDDFKDNAQDLYDAPGIFVPSRTSSSGKTYHYNSEYPHLIWYAGNAWTSQFFYDYWQFTRDEQFLREKAIPFMLASAEFYEFILTKDKDGKFMFIPSYSPEVGPIGHHPLVINATMDIAALKQLMRNLLKLSEQGWIKAEKSKVWKNILENLPDYAIDDNGDLKEWIWPDYNNNNEHRHASHLYPLFYEVDPDFENSPGLKQAAITAIENRLKYRRKSNGAEMAFGLVQKGLAAAHLRDTEHAYECVDWLCNSYWSPALTSYHDPGEIFNVDICGGLPAVVTEMIIQSSVDAVELLPALPEKWSEGKIQGVKTRCGVTVSFEWKNLKPVQAKITAHRNTDFTLLYKEREWPMELKKNQEVNWKMN